MIACLSTSAGPPPALCFTPPPSAVGAIWGGGNFNDLTFSVNGSIFKYGKRCEV